MTVVFRGRDEKEAHYEEVLIDGKSVSYVRLVPYEMRVGSSIVKMGGIAGVETKKEHRMKGYARSCITRTIKYMLDEGYDVSMLFGIPNFYTKFGYAPCLPQHILILNTRDAEEAQRRSEYTVRDFTEEDIESVLRIYHDNNKRRTCTVLRGKDWKGFRHSRRPGYPPPAFVLEKEGRVVAYVAFHRSMDPDEEYERYDYEFLVTEIGAESSHSFSTILNELASRALDRRFGRIHLSIPFDHPFAEYCRRFGAESRIEYPKNGGGMMRIINQKTLFEKIREELQLRIDESNLDEGEVEVKTELGSTLFTVEDGRLNVTEGKGRNRIDLPQSILTQLVVGYRSVEDVMNEDKVNVKGNTRLLKILFPRSFPYIWRIDRF